MGQKLERKLAKVFAENANGSYVTAFKTTGDETPTYSKDVEVIQNNEYENGWINGFGNDEVYGEDLNGVNYTQSYLTKYLYQMGVPEWKVDEEYFKNSYCQLSGDLYKSLSDNNIGNNPTTDDVNWVFVDVTPITASNLGTATGVFKQKNVSDLEFKSIAVSGNGSITADENTITIDIGGGETGTVYWENLPKNANTPTKIGQELATKQDLLGYTAENTANKVTEIRADTVATNTAYPTELATRTAINDAISGASFSLDGFDNNVGETSGTSYATIVPNGDYTNTYVGVASAPISSITTSAITSNWHKSVLDSQTYTSSTKIGSAYYYEQGNLSDKQILDITTTGATTPERITTTTITPYIPSTGTHITNLGTNSKRISNIYANNIYAGNLLSGGLFNLNGEINIRCADGESVEIGTDSSIKTLEVASGGATVSGGLTVTGTTSTDKIQGRTTATSLETGASIVPDTDNTYNLGSSSNKSFATTYTRKVGAPSGSNNKISFSDTNGGNVTYDCGIGGQGNYGSHVFNVGYGAKLTISGATTTTSSNILPNEDNKRDLGDDSTAFKTLYVNKLSLTTSGEGGANSITSPRFKVVNSAGSNGISLGYTQTTPIGTHNLGNSTDKFNEAWVTYLKTNQLVWQGNNGDKLELDYNIMRPTGDNAFNLGDGSHRFTAIVAKDFYGAYQPPSDRNKKDNIVERGTRKDAYSSLKAINDLKTYSYTFKNDDDKKTHIGIMAQELREVEPLLITDLAPEGSKQEDLYYDLTGYCTLLTEAVQELSKKVESLEARVEVLEKQKGEAEK